MAAQMITVEHLDFTYEGASQRVLRGLDFEIRRGEIFGFLGPSGAGKSTTQNILIGLLRGYRGSVSILGRELSDWGPDYHERIGVSFELPNHYLKLSARENLRYFRSLYGGDTEDPDDLLDVLGLGDSRNVRVEHFSKGMKARLNFARSLLPKPELLFLDEPTGGLDPGNARRVKDIIRQRRDAGTTVFVTTHNMTDADELCDRVAFLVDGVIALIDRPRTLKLGYGERVVDVEFFDHDGDGVSSRQFALDGLGQDQEFLRLIRDHRVRTIHSRETTLERVFLQVTGQELE